ncbi:MULTISPECIES: DUF4863 family protein [unclassified Streptomyces]|uniref:4-hydroxylaminobenzoate lyase n=1 Tax=unclassified Streptomyces TaxID=2593676 RepID=UPI002F90887A
MRGGLQPTSRSTAPSAGAVESPSLVPKLPCFSLTTVYRESIERYRGQYHQHSYGELHLVVHWATRLLGARGWCGAGWTAPEPGSHHYPEAEGGALPPASWQPWWDGIGMPRGARGGDPVSTGRGQVMHPAWRSRRESRPAARNGHGWT